MSTPAEKAFNANSKVWVDFANGLRETYGDGIHGLLHAAAYSTASNYAKDQTSFEELEELYVKYVHVAKVILDREVFQDAKAWDIGKVAVVFGARYGMPPR